MRRLLAFGCSVVLVETIFFAALAPLLPEFEETLGLSKFAAGVLVAMYAIGGVFGAIPGGWSASRLGIKRTTIAGLLLVTASCVAFGLVDEYALLCLSRFVQGFAAALCWNGAFAWLASSTPRERRGEVFGLAMGAAVGGALLGPVLGAIASQVGRAPAFGGMAGLAVALAAWAVTIPTPEQEQSQPLRMLVTAVRARRVRAGMWLLMLPGLLFGTVGVLAPLQLDDLGWGAVGIAATYVVATSLEMIINPLVGRWSDHRGRFAPIRVGLVSSAAGLLVLPWVENKWALSIVVIATSVAFGLFWAPATALLSDGLESSGIEIALGFALMNFAWAPGHIVGSAVGGGIAEAGGDAVAYGLAAALCVATLIALRGRQAQSLTAATKAAASG
jgi:MFS family permease